MTLRKSRAADQLKEIFGGVEGMDDVIRFLEEKGSDPEDTAWHSYDVGDARYAIGRHFPKSRLKAYKMNADGSSNPRSPLPLGSFLMHCMMHALAARDSFIAVSPAKS